MFKNWKMCVMALAAGLILIAGATAQNALKAKPTAVAVVDIAGIYNALGQKQVLAAESEQMVTRAEKEHELKIEHLKQLQADLELMQPGDAAYNKKRYELQLEAVQIKAWREFQKQRIAHEEAIRKEQLYRQILDAIGAFAQTNGYDMVLYKERTVNFAGANQSQVDALIALRKVLWSREELDITDAVTAKMNNDFNNVME